MPSSVHSSYPLSSRSNARRRLLVLRSMQASAAVGDSQQHPALAAFPGGEAEVPLDEETLRARFPLASNNAELQQIRTLLRQDEPLTWIFTGDSITQGAVATRGCRSYSELFSERVRWEMRRLRDLVINAGAAGTRAEGLLQDLQWRVLRFRPDVVAMMLGIGDSKAGPAGRNAFRETLQRTVEAVRAEGGRPVLQTPNKVDLQQSPQHADLPAYVDILRAVANSGDVPLIDHWAHWEQMLADRIHLRSWLASDGIHPGIYGHRELAKLLMAEFEILDANSPTCLAHVP